MVPGVGYPAVGCWVLGVGLSLFKDFLPARCQSLELGKVARYSKAILGLIPDNVGNDGVYLLRRLRCFNAGTVSHGFFSFF